MKTILRIFLIIAIVAGCAKTGEKEVVVYTSVDQIFSEPVLKEFEKKTGIKVNVVYDVEASKTTGLVNRLIAEKERPVADVFWNSEIGRTIALKKQGVLEQYRSASAGDIPPAFKDSEDYWTGFAARARVLIYNTNLLKEEDLPESIFELADARWKGKVALGYPLFGTTATHVAALYSALGKEKTEAYLRALKANDVVIVDGNAVARDIVVNGELPVAFTDTDDVNVAVQAGKPVRMIFPDRKGLGTLFIPNTVALIKGSPHPEEGKKMIDYLLSHGVERRLAFSESAQVPVRSIVERPSNVPSFGSFKVMDADYYSIADNMDRSARFSQELFVR